MRVLVGADYRGFEKKNQLLKFLAKNGYEVVDAGAYQYNEGDDFNDPAVTVSLGVRDNRDNRGILICGSAHGMTMQANRFKRVRAAHCETIESARLAREHDDANILCLSAEFMDENLIEQIAKTFLDTKFETLERRVRRINRLDEREDYD